MNTIERYKAIAKAKQEETRFSIRKGQKDTLLILIKK